MNAVAIRRCAEAGFSPHDLRVQRVRDQYKTTDQQLNELTDRRAVIKQALIKRPFTAERDEGAMMLRRELDFLDHQIAFLERRVKRQARKNRPPQETHPPQNETLMHASAPVQHFVNALLEDEEVRPEGASPAPGAKNPLDGRDKRSAVTHVYNKLHHLTTGFFTDNYWGGVKRILAHADQLGFPISVENTQYRNNEDGMPTSKTWTITIPFVNKKGMPDQLQGNITASGAGSVEDPLGRYDLTLVVS